MVFGSLFGGIPSKKGHQKFRTRQEYLNSLGPQGQWQQNMRTGGYQPTNVDMNAGIEKAGPWEKYRIYQVRSGNLGPPNGGHMPGGQMNGSYTKGPRPDGYPGWRGRWEQRQFEVFGPAPAVPEGFDHQMGNHSQEEAGPWEKARKHQINTGTFQPMSRFHANGPRPDGRRGWKGRWEKRMFQLHGPAPAVPGPGGPGAGGG